MKNRSTSNNPTVYASIRLPEHFALSYGGNVRSGKLGYSIYGNKKNPSILVLGGISAGRDIAHSTENFASGWWSPFVGSGKAIDTKHYCVIGIDFIGGNGISSAPEAAFGSPLGSVSTYDQAQAIAHLIANLGIGPLQAVIGSSYGGMVGLSLLQNFPKSVKSGLVISAAARAHPYSTAIRYIQRQIVQQFPSDDSLIIARALAMVSYRSAEEFAERFSNDTAFNDQGFRSDITDYLIARGSDFARGFDAQAFLRLSESIDTHRIDAEKISRSLFCVSVDSDQIIPQYTIEQMAKDAKAKHQTIKSIFGHDAFLKETEQLEIIIHSFLQKDL